MLGHNRRTEKFDGSAKMYGVNDPDFMHYEGIDDDRVQLLFIWDRDGALTGMVINTVATAQITDGSNLISADVYHVTLQAIR